MPGYPVLLRSVALPFFSHLSATTPLFSGVVLNGLKDVKVCTERRESVTFNVPKGAFCNRPKDR